MTSVIAIAKHRRGNLAFYNWNFIRSKYVPGFLKPTLISDLKLGGSLKGSCESDNNADIEVLHGD